MRSRVSKNVNKGIPAQSTEQDSQKTDLLSC